jgi:hypothetical protein
MSVGQAAEQPNRWSLALLGASTFNGRLGYGEG